MGYLQSAKSLIGALTEIGLMLVALGIVVFLLVGTNTVFVANPVGNIIGLVKQLGDAGIVGLISLGLILWLFSNRNVT